MTGGTFFTRDTKSLFMRDDAQITGPNGGVQRTWEGICSHSGVASNSKIFQDDPKKRKEREKPGNYLLRGRSRNGKVDERIRG